MSKFKCILNSTTNTNMIKQETNYKVYVIWILQVKWVFDKNRIPDFFYP